MARILSIDFGTKRVGIAVTDPLQIIASPLTTVKREELHLFLDNYMIDEEVEKIVFGYPTHADGAPMSICKKINEFITELKVKFPELMIDTTDESYSSVEAMEVLIKAGFKKKKRRQKELIDKVSACIILQRYLHH